MNLPPDIELRINNEYQVVSEQSEVKQYLESLWNTALNVGPVQLSRAILVLADGDILKFRKIAKAEFYGDPRDLIMMAKGKTGDKNNDYFTEPFQDVE